MLYGGGVSAWAWWAEWAVSMLYGSMTKTNHLAFLSILLLEACNKQIAAFLKLQQLVGIKSTSLNERFGMAHL